MSDRPDWAVDYPETEPRLEPLQHYLEEAGYHYQPSEEALEGIDRADRDARIVRVTVDDLRQVLTGSGTGWNEAWRRLMMVVDSVQPTYPPESHEHVNPHPFIGERGVCHACGRSSSNPMHHLIPMSPGS